MIGIHALIVATLLEVELSKLREDILSVVGLDALETYALLWNPAGKLATNLAAKAIGVPVRKALPKLADWGSGRGYAWLNNVGENVLGGTLNSIGFQGADELLDPDNAMEQKPFDMGDALLTGAVSGAIPMLAGTSRGLSGKLLKDKTLIINGEGHDMELLNDEGFDDLDAFISLTANDEENILACVAARRKGIRKTIAQVENLAYLDMAEDLDVGTVINKKTIAASYIYQLLLKSDVDNVKMLNVADADVAEFVVKKNSKVTKSPVMKIGLPHGVNIGGMVRDGKGQLVRGNTVLEEGDRVVVFCIGSTLKQLDKFFK